MSFSLSLFSFLSIVYSFHLNLYRERMLHETERQLYEVQAQHDIVLDNIVQVCLRWLLTFGFRLLHSQFYMRLSYFFPFAGLGKWCSSTTEPLWRAGTRRKGMLLQFLIDNGVMAKFAIFLSSFLHLLCLPCLLISHDDCIDQTGPARSVVSVWWKVKSQSLLCSIVTHAELVQTYSYSFLIFIYISSMLRFNAPWGQMFKVGIHDSRFAKQVNL